MSDYTPVDDAHTTIDLPNNGENANAVNLATASKDIADNAEVLRQGMIHIATPDVLTPAGRTVSDGVKRLRRLVDFTALAALVVGADNDREVVTLASTDGANLQYIYEHGNADPVYSPFLIASNGDTGRWVIFGFSLLDMQPGLPYVDEDGRLQNVTTVPDGFVQIAELDNDGTVELPGDVSFTTDETAFQDPDSDSIFTVTDIEEDDEIEVTLTVFARLEAPNADGDLGFVALFIGQGGSFTKTQTAILIAHKTDLPTRQMLQQLTLTGKYTAVSNADVVIKPKLKSSSPGGTVQTHLYTPIKGVARVRRP